MPVDLKDIKAKPEPRRDHYGRYMIPNGLIGKKAGHEPYTRATTVAKGMADTYGLEQWQQGQVANGMGRKPPLVKLARSHPKYDEAKGVYREIVEAAFEASDGADGRRAGTALHKQTERLDLGEISTDDADLDADDRARLIEYEAALAKDGIEVEREHVEEIVIFKGMDHADAEALDGWRIAGTPDRVLVLPDGRRVIGDLKTGKSMDHGKLEFAVQLAIYANHTNTYNVEKDKLGPRIDVDRSTGIIIHLPSLGDVSCEVYTIDLDIGYGALICAMERREWQKQERNVLKPYRVSRVGTGGSTAQRDWLAERIQRIITASHGMDTQIMANGDRHDPASLLVALWDLTDIPMPLPQTLSPDDIQQMDGVCSGVEMAFELAIAPSPPGEEIIDPTAVVHTTKKATKKTTKKQPAKKATAKKAAKKQPAKKATTRKKQ